MQIPYTFAGALTSNLLANLDANFAAVAAAVNATSVPAFVSQVGGTGNAITLTPDTPITSYAKGQTYMFIPGAPNTGATTIATSGLGTRNLLYSDGTPMTGGELLVGGCYQIEDTGAAYVLMNSAQATGIVSWTPVLSFGGSSTGITYTLQQGISCKIGRIVYFAFALQLSSKGAQAGNAQVGGLPYTINAGWVGNNAGPVVSSNLTFSGYCAFGYVLGGTTMTVTQVTSGAAFTVLTNTAFSNTTLLAGSSFYAT